jgi:hypothetical protein
MEILLYSFFKNIKDWNAKPALKKQKATQRLVNGFLFLEGTPKLSFYSFSKFLEITNFWISVVPSPIVHNLESL